MRELALFAGAGGGILGGKLLGWRTICAVEIEPYPISVLIQRQNEGILPPFPIWDDIRTFDGNPWRGTVDVVSGGFPCQDISAAGKGKGITGERSGLWCEMARIVGEVQPRFAFVENASLLRKRGLDRVLSDFAKMGYDAEWGVFSARDVGASHLRKRIFILASDTHSPRLQGSEQRPENRLFPLDNLASLEVFPGDENELSSPRVVGAGNGLADRVDRTKAIGNGQVPLVAATAWTILMKRLFKEEKEEDVS